MNKNSNTAIVSNHTEPIIEVEQEKITEQSIHESTTNKQNELDSLLEKESDKVIATLAKEVKERPELLDKLLNNEEIVRIVRSVTYEGPLPAPGLLSGYEELLPGATERLFNRLEEEQAHRESLEGKALYAQIKRDGHSQIFGAFLSFIALCFSFILGLREAVWLAGILGTTTIATILTIFILNKLPEISKNKHYQDKNN